MSGLSPAQQAALNKQDEQRNMDAPSTTTGSPGMTSVESILSGYQRGVITLPESGWTIEVQSLSPGDYLSVYGSALQAMMTASGLDYLDKEQRVNFERDMSDVQKAVIAQANLQNFRRVVCKAIISMSVSMEPQWLCPQNVLSVYQIADTEVVSIYKEVDKLSGWSVDVDRFQGTMGVAEGREGEE